MEVCIELADVSREVPLWRPFVRLSVALEKKWPDMQGWQLEQILDLCDIATYSVNSFFTGGDTFLKIAISLKNPQALFLAPFSSAELMQMITDGSEPQITIRRNVVPKQGYWTKLQEVCHRSHWTREFYPNHVLEQSLRQGKSLMQKLKERRQRGEQCELARSLRRAVVEDFGKPVELPLVVDRTEFASVKRLASGTEGTVWKVVWENCTYAMKSFTGIVAMEAFSKELSIARLGPLLHPNILCPFGHSPDDLMAEEAQPFLLMELLDGDLLRCVYEYARAPDVARLCFSRVDRLDVLLQIAMAMRNLHENWWVHGDLKLGNILVSEFEVSGNVQHFVAKVADFGSAKKIEFGSSFVPNGGTTAYASPEVLRCRVGRNEILSAPKKLDVYSFGVIAYEVLTGHRAFNGKLDTEKIRQVSTGEKKLIDSTEWRNLKGGFGYFDEVISLVERCLEFDPEKRPPFSMICDELSQSKSNLQDWEKTVAAYQKSFVTLSAIIVMLFVFLQYASRVWIITVSPEENTHFRWIPVSVLLIVTACLIGSWACRPKFLSIRLKAKIK